ncbi:MAG: hypothetical protein WC817_04880 [Patescibacteria group bacterium]|jgi:hypothetical protein
MDKRKIIIVAGVTLIILVLVGGGLWYVGWFSGKSLFSSFQTAQNKNNSGSSANNNTMPTPVTPVVVTTETNVLRLARLFAERFGSFSTDEKFAGIEEIKPLMTDTFASWVENTYIPELKSRYPKGFGAETTRVLHSTVVQQNDAAATVRVAVQRTVTSDSSGSLVKNTTLRVDMVKRGDGWLVNAVFDEGKY